MSKEVKRQNSAGAVFGFGGGARLMIREYSFKLIIYNCDGLSNIEL
jgi:hypothetical protein